MSNGAAIDVTFHYSSCERILWTISHDRSLDTMFMHTALRCAIEISRTLTGSWVYSPLMKIRENHETAALIDASINILREQGMYAAACMLCEAGVTLETACRVLRQPAGRRLSDNSVIHLVVD